MSVKTFTQWIVPDVFWDLCASVVTSARRVKCLHVIQLLGPKDSLIFLQNWMGLGNSWEHGKRAIIPNFRTHSWCYTVKLPLLFATHSWSYAVKVPLLFVTRRWCYEVNFLVLLAKRSWCYAVKILVLFATPSCCSVANFTVLLATRSWCYAVNCPVTLAGFIKVCALVKLISDAADAEKRVQSELSVNRCNPQSVHNLWNLTLWTFSFARAFCVAHGFP